MAHVEQELITLPEHSSSSRFLVAEFVLIALFFFWPLYFLPLDFITPSVSSHLWSQFNDLNHSVTHAHKKDKHKANKYCWYGTFYSSNAFPPNGLVLHCMHGIRSHYNVLIFSLKSNLELSLNTTSVQQFQVSFRHDLDALFYHNYVQTPLNHCNSSTVYITLFRFTLPLI
jgi:hypothetical protein